MRDFKKKYCQLQSPTNRRFYPKKKPHVSVKLWVSAEGFEPSTASLEGRCSIQLSYAPYKLKYLLSGWQDSNLRPPRPKRGAMTGLRYTPSKRIDKIAERKGFEPPVPVKVQLLSREPRSATPAPLLDFQSVF